MQTPTEKPTKEKARILTDVDFKRVTCPPGKNRHRLSDSGGLYLEVTPAQRSAATSASFRRVVQ